MPIQSSQKGAAARWVLLAVTITALLLSTSCGSPKRSLNVFVASSMTEFAEVIRVDFERKYPEIDVRLNIAGSGALVNQIVEGASADLVLLAGATHMDRLQKDGSFLRPVTIARNSLTVVMDPRIASDVNTLADLTRGDRRAAICIQGAPCGALAFAFAEASGVDLSTATREPNVKAVLARVSRGEVDFGFVYRSDAQGAQEEVIEMTGTGADAFITSYSLAVARDGQRRRDINAFADAITHESAWKVLQELGFLRP